MDEIEKTALELPELPTPEWRASDGVSPGVYSAEQMRAYALAALRAAPAGAPSVEAAAAMGAKGGQAGEPERLAFEAWMKGHCWWPVGVQWGDFGYSSSAESLSYCCPQATMVRRLWAAWRDRAALAAPEQRAEQQGAFANEREVFAEWHRRKGCSQQIINDCLSGLIAPPELAADLVQIALAARQPVGQALVAVVGDDGYPHWLASFLSGTKWADAVVPGTKLYTAPPAPSVPDDGKLQAAVDRALGLLSTALDDLDSSPDRRPGAMVSEAMETLRDALAGQPQGEEVG